MNVSPRERAGGGRVAHLEGGARPVGGADRDAALGDDTARDVAEVERVQAGALPRDGGRRAGRGPKAG